MLHFTRNPGRRAGAAVVACALVFGSVAVPLAAADDLKDKQNRVERDIDEAHDDLEFTSTRLRAATERLRTARATLVVAQEELAATRSELRAARIRDRQMQIRLDAAEQRLEEARADLAAGQQEVSDQRIDLGQMAAETYQQGDPELLGMVSIMRSDDPEEITRQAAATDARMSRESAAYDGLRATEVLLVIQEEAVEDATEVVAAEREIAAENLARMKELEVRAQEEAAGVRDLVAARSSARSEADRARRADAAELRELERESSRIETMLRRRAAAALRAAAAAEREAAAAAALREAASRVGAIPDSRPASSGSVLSSPADGYVTSPFGIRTHPIYGYRSLHDGTDFGAGCGSPLYAAADGTVISRYYQTAYGNRLLIDHGLQQGQGLATIYNHATSYTVSAGQRVQRGQVIGYVGSTGWSTGCHLHFTVMANGSPVDPMNWL